MKIMLKIWILCGVFIASVIAQKNYDSDYLVQDEHNESGEKSYPSYSSRHQHPRSYEPASYEDGPSGSPNHYQSLEPTYHRNVQKSHGQQPSYHRSHHIQYHQPEDPSYHRPQEIAYHQTPQHYQDIPQHHKSYDTPARHYQPEVSEHNHDHSYEPPKKIVYHQPEIKHDQSYDRPLETVYHQPEIKHDQSYDRPRKIEYHQPEIKDDDRSQEIVYRQPPKHYQEAAPDHQPSYERSTHYDESDEKEPQKYSIEEPKYSQAPRSSHSSHPTPLRTDPKLPLYFTMYEKRVIQDPTDKYGKGPWRYLTYGHGITYGSKEPGKVFEKGYGYIRALGRDHCKLPEHLCPPKDDKPFDYEGRKEPYFGYRPH